MIFQSTEIDYPISNRLLTAFLPAEKFSLKSPLGEVILSAIAAVLINKASKKKAIASFIPFEIQQFKVNFLRLKDSPCIHHKTT